MPECIRCDRWFRDEHALNQHINDSFAHWMCWKCGRDFTSQRAQQDHFKNSSQHYWCNEGGGGCGVFDTQPEYIKHCETNHCFCRACFILFPNERTLNYHFGTQHDYCSECRRFFTSENNLRMHLNSKLHKIANVPCFGAPSCDRKFISLSDAILHIENGNCPSGLTGAQLRRLVIKHDRNRVITNPSRMIGYRDDDEPRNYATERARNQNGYYVCVICGGEYTSLRALNSHYASNAHAAKIFRCPNNNRGCHKEFRTLSGVIQHIEDGYCGARDSRNVQDGVASLMKDMVNLRLGN